MARACYKNTWLCRVIYNITATLLLSTVQNYSQKDNSDVLKDVMRKIKSIVQAVPVYGRHMQTVCEEL